MVECLAMALSDLWCSYGNRDGLQVARWSAWHRVRNVKHLILTTLGVGQSEEIRWPEPGVGRNAMVLLMAADKQYAVHLPGITKGACGTTVADLFVCFAGGSRATHPLAYILGQPGIIRRSNSPSDQ